MSHILDPDSVEIPVHAVRDELERILGSAVFAGCPTLSRFLRFVVTETLEGRGDLLKEYVLGTQVFGRGDAFDPRIDPIVRVQARNLRLRLDEYYRTEGQADPIRIEVPRGSYAPQFTPVEPARPAESRKSGRRWFAWTAAAMLLGAAAGTALYWSISGAGARRVIETPSVAVLPFSDLSPAQSEEYFSDGLTDEVISALTRVHGLRVAARNSSFSYKGKKAAPREIGRALKVGSVLSGSVRKEGDKIRITAQLIDVNSGYYLWSNTFERRMQGILSVQEEISRAIVETLRVRLARGGELPLQARTDNVEAYSAYLRGRYLYNKQTEGDLRKSIGHFRQAVARDPSYAAAFAGLGDAYNLLVQYGNMSPREGMPQAKEAALRALRLDGSLAEAHVTLATVLEAYDWNWTAAEREYRRAIDLNPDYAPAHLWYGLFLWDQNRLSEAAPELRRAYELDPLSLLGNVNIAAFSIARGDYQAAVEQLEKVVELDPQYARAYLRLGVAYRKLARGAEAAAALERARQLTGEDPATLAVLACDLARADRKTEVRQILSRLEDLSRRRYVSAFDLALVHAALGESSRALELLEKAYDERSSGLVLLRLCGFESLRSSPRFAALVSKMHFMG